MKKQPVIKIIENNKVQIVNTFTSLLYGFYVSQKRNSKYTQTNI